jgi:hypothetical protein
MGREELLRCSLGIAGLTERVNITRMPFAGEVFDSIVSKHAMFHLWENGCCGADRSLPVLRPGGRILMVVLLPGSSNFGLIAPFSHSVPAKQQWQDLISQSGFGILDEPSSTANGSSRLRNRCSNDPLRNGVRAGNLNRLGAASIIALKVRA